MPVLFDPKSRKVKFDSGAPEFSLRAKRRAQEAISDDHLREVAAEPPGTPVGQSESSTTRIESGPETTIRPD